MARVRVSINITTPINIYGDFYNYVFIGFYKGKFTVQNSKEYTDGEFTGLFNKIINDYMIKLDGKFNGRIIFDISLDKIYRILNTVGDNIPPDYNNYKELIILGLIGCTADERKQRLEILSNVLPKEAGSIDLMMDYNCRHPLLYYIPIGTSYYNDLENISMKLI